MNLVEVTQGDSPIILGQPHSGTYVPDEIFSELNDIGRQLLDTDWHIPKLYEGLVGNVTVVKANFNRYFFRKFYFVFQRLKNEYIF